MIAVLAVSIVVSIGAGIYSNLLFAPYPRAASLVAAALLGPLGVAMFWACYAFALEFRP